MRAIVVSIGVVLLAVSATAWAKPKVAIVPLDGDDENEVGETVAVAIDSPEISVMGPKAVGKKMEKIGIGDDPDPKELRKLERSLGVVAIISGKLSKAGKTKKLHLEVYVHGKPKNGFTVEFRKASAKLKRDVHDKVVEKVGDATEEPPDDPPPPPPSRPRLTETDDPGRHKPKDPDADPPKRKPREQVADTDDTTKVRKRKRRRGEDEGVVDGPNPALTAIHVGAGVGAGQRNLSFDTRSGFTQIPPTVSTGAASGRIEAELYPFALSNPNGGAAGIGIAGGYDKTVGLSIKVPNMATQIDIDQSHYSVGARYRFAAGDTAAIALGVDYARRSYIQTKSGMLDMPDVDYTAVAPTGSVRFAATPSVIVFGGLDVMLILDTGPIQKAPSYGAASVYGVEGAGGVDIAFTKQLGLRLAAEVSMIKFSFSGKGDMTKTRDGDSGTIDVTGATDRAIGLAATLGLNY